jgi:uncharacterized lipoprotein YmbA
MRRKLTLYAFTPVALVASVALLIACSSPAPQPTSYLLRGEATEASGLLDGSTRAGIGRLIVAPYLLSSQGVVVESAPGVVQAARQHRWAEPLDAGLRWFLRAEIAKGLGDDVGAGLVPRQDWDYTIDIYIAQFHGTMSGTAILEATYLIRPTADSEEVREYAFSKSQPQSDEGYAALVAAEQNLASELGAAIAGSLRELMAQRETAEP